MDIDTEKFFRAVDRAVLECHSRPSGLPLILAALPEHHHVFHELSRNPFLIPESIDIHPDALSSIDELRQRAWQHMEPRHLARLAGLVEQFGNAKSKGLGDEELAQVAKAVVGGRVETLMIEARREVPGRIDATTGDIELDFSEQVTRVEIHLSDENSKNKSGTNDKRCLVEVRLAGVQPISASDQAETLEQAVDGAIEKLKRSLDSTLGRLDKR